MECVRVSVRVCWCAGTVEKFFGVLEVVFPQRYAAFPSGTRVCGIYIEMDVDGDDDLGWPYFLPWETEGYEEKQTDDWDDVGVEDDDDDNDFNETVIRCSDFKLPILRIELKCWIENGRRKMHFRLLVFFFLTLSKLIMVMTTRDNWISLKSSRGCNHLLTNLFEDIFPPANLERQVDLILSFAYAIIISR